MTNIKEFTLAILETEDYIITYRDDEETKNKLFEMVLSFLTENEAFNGESIHQNDVANIELANFMTEIADEVMKFNVEYKEYE